MIQVGGRVLKTGVAAGLSIFVARILNLEPAVFAALISMLSVQRSFSNSVRRSLDIVMSVIAGSLIGAVFAFSFGLHPLAVTAATVLMIIICIKLKWQDQIVLSVVTVLTLMEFDSENFFYFTSQRILTGLIGAFCGIMLNLPFMPYHRKNVVDKLREIDAKSRVILELFTERLNPGNREIINFSCININKEIEALKKDINEGIELSKLLREEQRYRFVPETPPEKYLQNFYTFTAMSDTLQDMNNVIDYINTYVPHLVPVIRISKIINVAQRKTLAGKKIPTTTIEKLINNLEEKKWWRIPPDCESDFFTRAALFNYFMELKKYYRSITRLNPVKEKEKEKQYLITKFYNLPILKAFNKIKPRHKKQ